MAVLTQLLAAACSGEMEFSAKSAAANFSNFAKEHLASVCLMAFELLFFLAKLHFHTVCEELLKGNTFFLWFLNMSKTMQVSLTCFWEMPELSSLKFSKMA